MGKWVIYGCMLIALCGCNDRVGLESAGAQAANVLEQGNSQSDVEITQKIRKSIVVEPGKDQHSVAAKNIQIVTRNGMVTLSGKVRSEAERSDLEKRAQGIAGKANVRNLLVVDPEKP